MSRKELLLPQEHLVPLDLEAFVNEAATLHQRTVAAFAHPFPKAPDRWLSHDQFRPRPIAFTLEGEVEGGLRWLLGATSDLCFTRALCAPYDAKEGGPCDDPASSFFLEVASRVDGSPDSASCWADLRPQDKGRRSRELAGLHAAIPGEEDLCHFRRRVDASAIEAALAVCVGLFRDFGLITGELLSTDGQLEPSSARFKGCAYCCQACRQLPVEEARRDALARQRQAGATRLEIRCPFPDVVQQVRQATPKQGKPREPTVALLESEDGPADSSPCDGRQQLSERLSRPPDQLPPRRLKWSQRAQGPQGEIGGCCPKVPSDLDAKVGYHIDNQHPPKTERGFGYLQHTTTNIDVDLGLEVPVGTSTYPANVPEGSHLQEPRAKVALPFLAQQVELTDAGDDLVENDQGIRGRGGIPLIASQPRRDALSPEALWA